MESPLSTLYMISAMVIPAITAITLHEAAHGYIANKLGDDTALRQGRVTFNPLRHIDPFGTLILPALLLFYHAPFAFGYAKPVPVNFNRLKNPRRDMVWVALAGPGINIGQAFVAGLLANLLVLFPTPVALWLGLNLRFAIELNLILALFNMIPLPPLDGGRVAVGLLPDSLARPLAKLERYGIFILLGILIVLPTLGNWLGMNLNLFAWLLGPPVDFLYDLIVNVTGL